MNPAPCAKLKAFVELGLQGLVQSTRMALRHAPVLDGELFGELLNLGLWEAHLGEMPRGAGGAYEVPQDVAYREEVQRPRAAEVDTDEEWQLCSNRSGAGPTGFR